MLFNKLFYIQCLSYLSKSIHIAVSMKLYIEQNSLFPKKSLRQLRVSKKVESLWTWFCLRKLTSSPSHLEGKQVPSWQPCALAELMDHSCRQYGLRTRLPVDQGLVRTVEAIIPLALHHPSFLLSYFQGNYREEPCQWGSDKPHGCWTISVQMPARQRSCLAKPAAQPWRPEEAWEVTAPSARKGLSASLMGC